MKTIMMIRMNKLVLVEGRFMTIYRLSGKPGSKTRQCGLRVTNISNYGSLNKIGPEVFQTDMQKAAYNLSRLRYNLTPIPE